MPTLRANGLDVGYDVMGAGPPLVLLHGASSLGREDFAAQLPGMSKAFLVHLPDARGHGRTTWDASMRWASTRSTSSASRWAA
jgi:pimeloyl-ACP methyl ester carboxylesterase